MESWYKVTLTNDVRCLKFIKACDAGLRDVKGAAVYTVGMAPASGQRVFFCNPKAVLVAKALIETYGGSPSVAAPEDSVVLCGDSSFN